METLKIGKQNKLLLMQLEKELDFIIEEGEAAFYGPKLDFMVGMPWVESGNLELFK